MLTNQATDFFPTADSNALHSNILVTAKYRRSVLENLTSLLRLYCCRIPPVLNFRWSVLTWKNAQEYWNQTCKQKIIHRNSSAQVGVWHVLGLFLSFSGKIGYWFIYMIVRTLTLCSFSVKTVIRQICSDCSMPLCQCKGPFPSFFPLLNKESKDFYVAVLHRPKPVLTTNIFAYIIIPEYRQLSKRTAANICCDDPYSFVWQRVWLWVWRKTSGLKNPHRSVGKQARFKQRTQVLFDSVRITLKKIWLPIGNCCIFSF